jgi:hypothetical protein
MMTVDQFQKLLAAIEAIRDHAVNWNQLFITALPTFLATFLASILGFATALLLDWLRTRRDNRKVARERLEKELAQLSGASTAMGFNVEALTHIVYQQILPHYEAARDVLLLIERVKENDSLARQKLNTLFFSKYQSLIMMRSPALYLMETDFFKDLPFITGRDPEALKLSGWILTYTNHLRGILTERNKQIDIVTNTGTQQHQDIEAIERAVETQESISKTEIVNVYLLLAEIKEMSVKLEQIIKNTIVKYLEVSFVYIFPIPPKI